LEIIVFYYGKLITKMRYSSKLTAQSSLDDVDKG